MPWLLRGPAPKQYEGFTGQIERGWDALVSVVGSLVLLLGLLRLTWLAAHAHPVTRGRWREIAASPILDRDVHTAVWSGEEMVVWGGQREGGLAALGDGAAYNPARDTWRELPPAGQASPTEIRSC